LTLAFTLSILGTQAIQFNSKPLYNDGDPVSSQLIFPGTIQTCDQTIQHLFIHIYKHNTGSSDKHRQTQLTLSYKTCIMIHICYE